MEENHTRLAERLTGFSTQLKKGERVLIDAYDTPVEMVVALVRAARARGAVPFVNLQNARVTGAKMELRTEVVARTGSAKEYSAGHRLYGLVDGALLWTFDMTAMGHPLSNHLAARLLPTHEPRAAG